MVVTRFAPSPTGYLHVGGLRTALFSWLHAKHNGGKFILRVEDTDLKRNSEAAVNAILEAFKWVGLDYDGEVFYQSKRGEIYKKYIKQLLNEGKAYYCYMSKEELDDLRQNQQKRGETPRYDGRYRDGKLPPRNDVAPVVRIKAPQEGEVVVDDGIKGVTTFNWIDMCDDFIIARSDGTPTFNFCVAIDDALLGVTDVIRGDDHLSNVPKQMVVYKALDLPIPRFFHVPMIHNEKGKKLSKRDGAMDVMEYKTLGYLPQALLNFLVRLGWSNKDQEIFSLDDMIKLFDAHKINKSASAYSLEKLLWLNRHYIKSTSNEDLAKYLNDIGYKTKNLKAIDIFKAKVKTLLELRTSLELFDIPPQHTSSPSDEDAKTLSNFAQILQGLDLSSEETIDEKINEFLNEFGLKMPALGKPLRMAFFNQTKGAALAQCLMILGKDESMRRINSYIKD